MEQFESYPNAAPSVELRESDTGHEVRAAAYSLRLEHDSPYLDLYDSSGIQWMQIFKGSNIATSESADTTYAFEPPVYETTDDGSVAIRIASHGETGGHKEQVWVCHEDYIETVVTAETTGSLQDVTLLGGNYVAPNMFGESLSQRYFNSVYNPQPSEMERPISPALESTKVTTSGMWKPGRRREFLITQPALGFCMAEPVENDTLSVGPWLIASLSAPIDQQNFAEFRYDVHEDGFLLRLAYDGTPVDSPAFTTPSLLLHFAPSPLEGLQDAKQHAIDLGHLRQISPPRTYDWHRGSTWVSWGEQQEQARRFAEEGHEVAARDIATQEFITDTLQYLEEKGVPVDIYTIDDKWQKKYGTNTPDTKKWPDMPGFNTMQKACGRRAILWMKLFDPEGLPPELCITNTEGLPIASDPTNPNFLEFTWEQVRYMLHEEGLNADGLKPDFIAQLPHGPGLRWHGNARGAAALHQYMKIIYDAAIFTKRDALVQAQIVHPWFADTLNHIRVNDTNEFRGSPVVTLGRRAALAAASLPGYTINADGWPMLDRAAWQEYIKAQPELTGSITTHFARSVNAEPLGGSDYDLLRDAVEKTK